MVTELQSPQRLDNQPEALDYGIVRWWCAEGRIAVLKTQGDMSHQAVNAWADTIINMLKVWETTQPIAFLHDLRAPSQGLTPHSRQRVGDILNAIPSDNIAYTAILMPNTFINSLISWFVRTQPFRKSNHHVRVFTDYDVAMNWLKQHI